MEYTLILNYFNKSIDHMKTHISYWRRQSIKPSCVFACFFGLDEEKNSEMIKAFKHETRNIENVHVIESTFNFKYIGRYQIALGAPTENIIMMDDDRFPRSQYAEFMLNILSWKNAIIGQDGWMLDENKNDCSGRYVTSWFEFKNYDKVTCFEGDYLCGGMVFKRNHLLNLFSKPFETKTGEDILMCMRNKKAGIPTHIYVPSKDYPEAIIAHNAENIHVTRNSDEIIDFRTKLIKEELSLSNKINSNNRSIKFFTFSDGSSFAKDTIGSISNYCSKHDYDFDCFSDDIAASKGFKPHWNKMYYAIDLLKSNSSHDYLVWIDHDILITNPKISMESIIEEYNFKNLDSLFMMSKDPCINLDFNSGIIVFKNTNESLNVFDNFLKIRSNCGLDFNKETFQDTQVMLRHFNAQPKDLLSIPHKKLQSFYGKEYLYGQLYSEGDFCAHFAGIKEEDRIKAIQRLNSK